MFPSIEKIKSELNEKEFDQGFHWKILFIGTSVNGTTDIVSSLSRSLRNLGHHVLDIDTRRHKILDNPLGRQGGMGPIYVNYDRIESILDSFCPQMIVCCAGGLTFTPSDAERLKERGIVLVGMTLSDPDVFPTIREHQHVFDVHTTNAEEALGLYKKAGVDNTIYFPFGIDRGFVTQNVPVTDAYDADVICLGHATQRPDRNEMMSHLNSRFDVKTYGRGWDIANSVTVAGQEMVQALQGGKIHINFPLTRAGYVNIKCGVFESASQGRVVATGNFPEMAKFFEYDDEIIGYENHLDLELKIQKLLDDPAEYERIALNAFNRVANEHLYEHRWISLFDEIISIGRDNNRWLSPERAARINQILSSSLPRAKKVILSGFYGARNLGDEMILRSITDCITEIDSSVQLQIAAESPARVESSHGLQSFDRKNHEVAAYHVKTSSAVLLGGGGLWHDYTFEHGGGLSALFSGGKISIAGFGILPLMGRVLDLPFHVIGLGVGPLSNRDAIASVRFLASNAESIYVRDAESLELLNSIGISDESVISAPDVVYAVDLKSKNLLDTEELNALRDEAYVVLGINLRPWAKVNMARVVEEVAAAVLDLSDLCASQGKKLAVIPLPMQGGESLDISVIREVGRRIKHKVDFIDLIAISELSIDLFLEILEICDVLLAMRLHASLIAHRMGVPSVGLSYDPKVRRHFDEVGRPEFGLNLMASSTEIFSALTLNLNEGISEISHRLIADLEEKSSSALKHAALMVSSAATNHRVYEVPTVNEAGIRPTATVKPLNASFNEVELHTSVLYQKREPNIGIHQLELYLDTERPVSGMSVEYRGFIKVVSSSPSMLYLNLESPYSNEKAIGCLFIEVQIGDYLFRQDLAETSSSIQIGFSTPGTSRIPFVFKLKVTSDSFKARSWREATRVNLSLSETRETSGDGKQVMQASGGTVLRM